MKKVRSNILAIVALVFLFGCSQNSPKSVAKNFLRSVDKMDYEGAKKYGTEETGKMLDMLSGFMKMMPDSSKTNETKSTIISESIDGDKATVTYKENEKDGEQVLNLVKIDDQWKVSMSKDNINGSSDNMDSGATSTDTSVEEAYHDTTEVKH